MQTNNKRILFFSTIEEDWGGSEELWAASIPYLQLNNIEVILVKKELIEVTQSLSNYIIGM